MQHNLCLEVWRRLEVCLDVLRLDVCLLVVCLLLEVLLLDVMTRLDVLLLEVRKPRGSLNMKSPKPPLHASSAAL